MYQMAQLQTFTKEELLNLLSTCAYYLSTAYQDIQEHELWRTANQATMACEFLRFEIASQNKAYLIH